MVCSSHNKLNPSKNRNRRKKSKNEENHQSYQVLDKRIRCRFSMFAREIII